ncbi:hypothetical protein Aoki45_13280 [Algoriphagus sp. oki45]|uniref:hypothetical protein n=1 Tax=Algoriphagus sp. oki45 TaxID=3067294 RepID=UPI0027FB68F2|nr:hypothetical protein Aoki45_13280 [Algoriphagus sp. oki45]
MKYFLYAGILGFSFWLVSEVMEMIEGYTPTVYYLTAGYHFLAGIGIWGLHKAQSPGKNPLSQLGALLALIAYLGLTFFPIQVMNSGMSIPEFLEAKPLYKVPGAVWFVGMILFGISVRNTRFFPSWTPLVFISGTLLFTAGPLLGLPTLLVNCTNSLFAITVIYMCLFGLKQVSIGK